MVSDLGKMAPYKLSRVVGYSSEDPLYPASNLISGLDPVILYLSKNRKGNFFRNTHFFLSSKIRTDGGGEKVDMFAQNDHLCACARPNISIHFRRWGKLFFLKMGRGI